MVKFPVCLATFGLIALAGSLSCLGATVGNVSSSGIVTVNIPENKFQDLAGNHNLASRSRDNSITLDLSLPVIPEACSDFDFNQAPEYATGAGPKGVAIADFDGDGLPDIVASFDYASNGFSLLRGIGGGGLAPKVDFTFPPNLISVEAVFVQDLNADGRPDVVISSSLNDKIAVFVNTSGGPGAISFASPVIYQTGGNKSRSVALQISMGTEKSTLRSHIKAVFQSLGMLVFPAEPLRFHHA